jgi:pimeloyl-ACP methyl ester carboxylesterase
MRNSSVAYGHDTLDPQIRSRFITGVNGLKMHLLEAGFDDSTRPCIVLLHGFPELAYSWRKLMPPLAQAGYHVIAPDQRGYGRTGGGGSFDDDLTPFTLLSLVGDIERLLAALGRTAVAAVVGHDFGSPVAAYCALTRPDLFRSVALMSAPFAGPPPSPTPSTGPSIHDDLAALPRPRKHYQWYYSTRDADNDMRNCPQGLRAFLRAYYHVKSADWAPNRPYPLAAWTASELAKLPEYYVMDLAQGMALTVAPAMPTAQQIAACRWLTERELDVYDAEFTRTGFQGGLNWYRCATDPVLAAPLYALAGRSIEIPACFIAGRSDWGIHQRPGDLAKMQGAGCKRLQCLHLVEGAGHWVQQEQPDAVADLILQFLHSVA